MKYFGKHCWWLVILSLVLGLQSTHATSEFPSPVKDILLEPITDLTTDGPVKMSMTVIPKAGFGDTLMFQIIGTQGLVSVGPDKGTVMVNKVGNFDAEFEILIPKNDSSQLTVQILADPPGAIQIRWFVTTEDTVEYWKANPRQFNGPFRSDPPTGRRGRIIPGEFPDLDSIYGIPPEMLHPDYMPDGTPKLKNRKEQPYFRSHIIDSAANEHSQLEEMRDYEKEPLIDAQVQYHSVGKDLYRRLEGEKEFTLVARKSSEEVEAERQAYMDSLAGLPPNAQVRVCLNLRGHHLEFVEKMVGPLGTPESESYYHLKVTRELVEQLREQGVPIMYLDLEDMVHRTCNMR